MKNRKTRITRVLVIFTLLAVILSAVLIPSSASRVADPIFSGSEYGITYNDGVYTISIDADRLTEILTSKSFDKSTLLSIMPESVYDLLTNRDTASVAALFRDLIDTAELGQLAEDLPIDYFTSQLTADEIIELIYINKVLDIIDIKGIISTLSADEIKDLFREGELEKLYESLDLTDILDDEKIKYLFDEVNNPNPLTTEEITNALKPGAVNRLIQNKSIDLENLLNKNIMEQLFAEENKGILTDEELQSVLKSETMIKKILEDEEVLNEILHNEILLEDLAAHPEVIDDLVSDQVIVEIFIDNGLLDTIIESATIPAAKLKEIVFENNIDVAGLITPDFIANLDPAVIDSLISTDDIVKLVECLSDEELEKIFENNSSAIDTSKLSFNDIYPDYISATDIKKANVIDKTDMEILAGLLDASEKNAIGSGIDFNSIGGFNYIYDKGYITDQDIINADVISDADIDILTSAPYLSDAEKDALIALGYTDINAIDFNVLFPTYITANEIKAAGVISADDVTKLAAAISDEKKVEIAIALDLIDITSIANYFTAEEIKNANVITDAEREALANCITSDKKIELALKFDCFDKSSFDFTELAEYISFDELEDVITNAELEALDPQIFIDAGLTATDVFNSLGTTKAAQIAIEIYTDGKIYDDEDKVIGNEYLHLEGIDFESVIDSISDAERTAIVEEIKKVDKIKDHITDVINADFSILAHVLDYPKLYKNGIITDDMVLNIISDDDITMILNKNIVTPIQVIDNIKDINELTSEITFSALPFDKLLSAFDTNELIDAIMEQNSMGLIKALNFKKLLTLDAIKSELKSLTLSDIKAVVNFDLAKDKLIAKAFKFINTDLKYIYLNDNCIQTNYDGFDIAGIEHALIDAIPTFDKIAEMDESGVAASFVFDYKIADRSYYTGFQIVFTGDTSALKEYAAKITEYVSFKIEKDSTITTKFTAPAKLASLYVSAVDGTKLPEAIRVKLAEIANVEFNKSDIGNLANAVISKLTLEELRAVISAVDVKNIDDKVLEQLNLRESQAQIILDYAASALNKTASFIENNPEINITLSSFYDKSLADFYEGNGIFNFQFDTQFDVMSKIERLKELPEDVKIFFTNTTITHKVNTTVEIRNLYKTDFVKDGEVIYTAFRTPDTHIDNITDAPTLAGMGNHGWDMMDADGIVTEDVSYTIAGDVQLAERFEATFAVYDSLGELVSEDVIYFSELTYDLADLTADNFAPEVEERDHYTFAWDNFTVTEYADFTVNGYYTPITYTIKFVADGVEIESFDYTIEDYAGMPIPTVPEKDHYTGKWDEYTLFSDDEITVNAIYTPVTYSIIFMANGVQVGNTQYYTIEHSSITEPAVPAKTGYRGYWPAYQLEYKVGQIVNAVYVLDSTPTFTYYITFVDEAGNVYGKIEFNSTTPIDSLKAPEALPTKEGYKAYWPDFKDLVMNDDLYIQTGTYSFTVTVKYEIIKYSVIFKADGKQIGETQYYTIENKNITAPEVPAKEGYTGEWAEYDLNVLGDKVIEAIYTKIDTPIELEKYYITFVDFAGNVIAKIEFTTETDPSTIKTPAAPERAGYNVSWPSFTLFNEELFAETGSYSFTVEAVYEAINYTATFMADGKVVAELTFTVETESLDEPAIPAKDGYTAVWSSYVLGTEDITIDAVYSTIAYKVTFVADGEEVAVRYYTVENKDIDEPAVPAKEGYTGEWEEYTLDMGDKTVNAVYTPVEETSSGSIYWIIMLAVLIAAGVVLVVIFFTKKKKDGADA